MNQALLHSLMERLDAMHQQYNLHFAGQNRVTRDPEMIALMIEAVETIEREARRLQANGDAALRNDVLALAEERLQLYRGERSAIADAIKEAGPAGIEAARIGSRANSVFLQYGRHFAGRARASRDLGLLQEMVDDLRTLGTRLDELIAAHRLIDSDSDRAVIAEQLALFESEYDHVRAARDAGTLDEQAGTLANVANGQFELYAAHFGGQPRVSRRPELLQRMIEQLEAVLARMEGLQEIGLHSEHNRANIGIVRQRMSAWQQELVEIRNAREQTSMLAMVEALAEAADQVLGAYNEHFAGQNRRDRELATLSALCDRMREIERQMEAIARAGRLTANERNMAMARDILNMLEREWVEIRGIQQPDGADG